MVVDSGHLDLASLLVGTRVTYFLHVFSQKVFMYPTTVHSVLLRDRLLCQGMLGPMNSPLNVQ